MGVAIVDDKMFAVGGFDGYGITSIVESYDFEIESWFRVKDMHDARSGFGIAVCRYFALSDQGKPIKPRKISEV
jgi:hypothetical protein